MTRPHDDHETNIENCLTSLGTIITAIGMNVPNSEDSLLYRLKMKIVFFL